ncbi:leishmanolysin-like peptidase isoform X2 [Trichogramma pretiosum]|uniref:leishmanolysin-like peptidase isoform X2 n=1 Tax=Trichogramma pretiosum TaxID=7493 RepID=UPI0006C9CC3A|nr:leishmanolysin-like peptidase isoform X2 [Trichogramma pretiosum]
MTTAKTKAPLSSASAKTLTNMWCFLVVISLIVVSSDADSGSFIDDHHRHCSHRHPRAHEVVHGVHVEPAHIVKKRSINQQLRILLHYDDSVYRLDDRKFELINNTILPEAVHFWERALMVRETRGTIRLNRKCESTQVFVKDNLTHCIDTCKSETMCGEVVVPEEHLDACRICNKAGLNCRVEPGSVPGSGIDGADFVFYVSAMSTERCKKGLTVAYAAHCQQEAALDRPIAGHANLCPESISTKSQELETLLSTVKHEILHALGFSVSLYAFYRDDKGEPRTRRTETGKPPLNKTLQTHQWSESTIRTVIRHSWQVHGGSVRREMQMVVTPRVTAEVRAHFGCQDLEGAELEDQGEDGTALTHWEKRVFENEAMTGTHTQNPVYSRITLALMEDTGWYSANYSMAQELGWGRGLGCDFAMKSCKEWIVTKTAKSSRKSIHPFCNKVKRDPLQTECTDDRSSVALCNLVEHPTPLPKQYQNFDRIPNVPRGKEEYYGGSVSLADYCPYNQEFTWRANNTIVRGSHCLYEDNNPHSKKNFALEKYGSNSRCFDHTNQMWEERTCKQVRQWQHWGSGCYRYKCEAGRLHIMVTNYTYTCYHAGQEIAIRIMQNEWLHKGALICPPCRDLCQEEFALRGEHCKPGDEHPPATFYHRDKLDCNNAARSKAPSLAFLFVVLLPALFHLR